MKLCEVSVLEGVLRTYLIVERLRRGRESHHEGLPARLTLVHNTKLSGKKLGLGRRPEAELAACRIRTPLVPLRNLSHPGPLRLAVSSL